MAHHGHAQSQGYWHELCAGGGVDMVFIADTDHQAPNTPDDATHHHHCPLCCGHGASWALPPSLPQTPALALERNVPVLFLLGHYTQHAWRTAQARGPPIFS
ncbi:DUF2946 family protein [Comamonas sp.]|uniref:DUF2946 family protein n=1 Tax=Comamonas sp. TaxID=34028 RepID=UPI00390C69BF